LFGSDARQTFSAWGSTTSLIAAIVQATLGLLGMRQRVQILRDSLVQISQDLY
jgi:hypothetical protein